MATGNTEVERIARLEARQDIMCNDIKEIKKDMRAMREHMDSKFDEIRADIEKLMVVSMKAAGTGDVSEMYSSPDPPDPLPPDPTIKQLLWKWGFWGAGFFVLCLAVAKYVGVF